MKKPNNITNVETAILSVQGTRVEHGKVLVVLDAEIYYYHRRLMREIRATAWAMVMADSNIDNAYITIDRYNSSKGKRETLHSSFDFDIKKWRPCKPKARLMATE